MYDYGCVMLDFDFDNWNTFIRLLVKGEDIDPEKGLEDEPHCTILYGLHKEVKLDDIISALPKQNEITCYAKNISLFENDNDVLKFDIVSPQLVALHDKLKEFPNSEKYPEYHAHCTIGYLKKGTGSKYVTELSKPLLFKPKQFTFSYPGLPKRKEIIRF